MQKTILIMVAIFAMALNSCESPSAKREKEREKRRNEQKQIACYEDAINAALGLYYDAKNIITKANIIGKYNENGVTKISYEYLGRKVEVFENKNEDKINLQTEEEGVLLEMESQKEKIWFRSSRKGSIIITWVEDKKIYSEIHKNNSECISVDSLNALENLRDITLKWKNILQQ